ncbi:centrosomal protein of 164 kDa-like isoform X2 [Stegodyphus dumicola]|uniref:centrosomal protein of 164 kDa-like isoform X2 n=1 Tax=Stegodyphus dumicola TaxID=202533 RepID=UPI0015A93C9A|nr:centrosomal protein of 164 kDa-like isoform X2 [Stegodyphus dumicola]
MASIKILTEDTHNHYELLEEDILEYAKQIGIDVENEKHLMWIAEEGLAAKVPEPWLILSDDKDRIFYYNKNTGETSWLHPLDKEYSALVSEERTRSKSLLSSSSDCGFESKLSSLADAPPLSSSGKNTPSSFKSSQNENASSRSKKIELGHFENRRGTQLAPVRLNNLKMPVSSSQKSGTGMSFMPKGSALSKNIRRAKEVPAHNDSVLEEEKNKSFSMHGDYNESENSDDGSKYSYEETDYEEEKDPHGLDPYDLGDGSQLSPIYSADESPEAFDINSLVQLGIKGPSKLDVPSKSSKLLMNNETSPSLSLRKMGQPSFLKPLQSTAKKKTEKNSKSVKKGNAGISKYEENPRDIGDIESKISTINEEQKVILESIQREWAAMQEELEKEEKAKYEQMVNESTKKLEEEEMKMRKENSAKLSELKNELSKKLKDEENVSEKNLEELKRANQVKYSEEEQKFKKELETLSESLKAEMEKMEEKNTSEINERRKELEDQLETETEELKRLHEINLKNLKESQAAELSMLEKAHQEELIKIKAAVSKESTEVEEKEVPKIEALQQEDDKIQKLLAELEEKYRSLSKEYDTLTMKVSAEKELLSKLNEDTTAARSRYEEIQDEVEKAESDLDNLMSEKSALISELNILKDNINNEKSNLQNLEQKIVASNSGKCGNSNKFVDSSVNTTLLCLASLCQFTQTSVDCKDASSQINCIEIFKTDISCQTTDEKHFMADKKCQVELVPCIENTTNITKNESVFTNVGENFNVDKANNKILESALNGIGKQMESRIKNIEEQLIFLQEKLTPINTSQSFKSFNPPKHSDFTEVKYQPNPPDVNILHDLATDKVSPPPSSSKIPSSNPVPRQSKCMCEDGDPESCEVMQAVKNSVYQLNDVLNLSFDPTFHTSSLVYGFSPFSYSSPVESFYVQFQKLQAKHRITELKHQCENQTMKQFKGSSSETSKTSTSKPSENDFIRSSLYTPHFNQNLLKKDDDVLARAQNIVLREQARSKKQQQQFMEPSVSENLLHPERHIMATDNFSQSVQFNVSRSFGGLPSSFLNFGAFFTELDPETDYNRWMARLNALQQKIRSHKMF